MTPLPNSVPRTARGVTVRTTRITSTITSTKGEKA